MKKTMILLAGVCICLFTQCTHAKKADAQQEQANGVKEQTELQQSGLPTATPDSVGYIVKVGDMAPDFEMELTDGSKVRLSSLRGKVVMLQFTASWCGVCRKEMPFIERDIWQKHKENPKFALYGIDRDEPLETVKGFAQKTGITYPLALDPGADIFALYADRKAGITRNVLIDKEGRIVMLTRLYNEEEFAALCKKIDGMLE